MSTGCALFYAMQMLPSQEQLRIACLRCRVAAEITAILWCIFQDFLLLSAHSRTGRIDRFNIRRECRRAVSPTSRSFRLRPARRVVLMLFSASARILHRDAIRPQPPRRGVIGHMGRDGTGSQTHRIPYHRRSAAGMVSRAVRLRCWSGRVSPRCVFLLPFGDEPETA